MLDPYTYTCLLCYASCSSRCANCRCIDDPLSEFLNNIIGCVDCKYYDINC